MVAEVSYSVKTIKHPNFSGEISPGEIFHLGYYQYSENLDTDIKWIILDVIDVNFVLAISQRILFYYPFSETEIGNHTWENSQLREYLNNDFIDLSFDDEEKEMLCICDYQNEDYISIPSYSDVKNYLIPLGCLNASPKKYLNSQSVRKNSYWLKDQVDNKDKYSWFLAIDSGCLVSDGYKSYYKVCTRPMVKIKFTQEINYVTIELNDYSDLSEEVFDIISSNQLGKVIINYNLSIYNCNGELKSTSPFFDFKEDSINFDIELGPNVTDITGLFLNCKNLTIPPFIDTSRIKCFNRMFSHCESIITVPLYDTSNAVDMNGMFECCYLLVQIPRFNTANVKNMAYMFYQTESLPWVPLLDTSNVEIANNMFHGAKQLRIIPKLNTVKCLNMDFMFGDMYCLEEKPDIKYDGAIYNRDMYKYSSLDEDDNRSFNDDLDFFFSEKGAYYYRQKKQSIKNFKENFLPYKGFSCIKNSNDKPLIIHFSHLYNVVNIFKQMKLLSRNKASEYEFTNSAGKAIGVDDRALDYVRFYYYSKTPTQFYNQGLGTKYNNSYFNEYMKLGSPKCPVPIFIVLELDDVLNNYFDYCFYSDGNLQSDESNLYRVKKAPICRHYFLNEEELSWDIKKKYKQREFLVYDQLDFTCLNKIYLVCENKIVLDILRKELKYINETIEDAKFSNVKLDYVLDSADKNSCFYLNDNYKINYEELTDEQIVISTDYELGFHWYIVNESKTITVNGNIYNSGVSIKDGRISVDLQSGLEIFFIADSNSDEEYLIYRC